jgi:hypothetical protein
MNKSFTFPILVALVAIGCGHPKTAPSQVREFQQEQASLDGPTIAPTTTTNRNQPVWVDNADRDGHLTAVGIAAPSKLHDRSFQREMAVNRGIAALGKKLSVQTDQLYLQLQSQTNSATASNKKAMQDELVEVSNTIRNLTSIKLRGARVPYFWTDSTDGTLYVLVQLNDDTSYDILKEAAANQPALKEAVSRLDAELAKR